MKMKTAAVIPVGPGREENLTSVLASLADGLVVPSRTVLVADGPDAITAEFERVIHEFSPLPEIVVHRAEKHQPGKPQPRNIGVRVVEEGGGDYTHAWFLDSDCIVEPQTLMALEWANYQDRPGERILIGRYDWLAQGADGPDEGLEMADPRRASFAAHAPSQTLTHDLSAGLACFSGNLVWPIARFKHVGGFWNEIHHGRCEDGELGLRAVQMGIPIGFVGNAQAWHLWHTRNQALAEEWNMRDVPMLNERHPWLEQRCTCGHNEGVHAVVDSKRVGPCKDCTCEAFTKSIFVVEEDGRRFNARCWCGWEGNTAAIWEHEATHAL